MAEKEEKQVPPTLRPEIRRLWVYAIDPWAETSLAAAALNRCILPVRWESYDLDPGPVGEYVEVVDVDPSSNCVYEPVDLRHPHLVARNGLDPSEGNPQFHQQMVYAVVMKTIDNFERALGRPILWSPHRTADKGKWDYVPHLRIYPHALREANAYYSPDKKSLLFGYFNAPTNDDGEQQPGGMVFTCLSHDIIAHETSHAILDGIHRRLLEATNEDMLAFHEAFADVVAIFQHFTLPGLVLDQISRTRGDLAIGNLLASLATQFGYATGQRGALRNALGRTDDKGVQLPPDPGELARTTEPHARGAILVAAIFDAFLAIYSDRVKDLRRIATGGTGVLPQGDIHPDLAQRFADEAIKASQRVLTICIRALDYLPPVDITFGDYLRALITADAELVPEDPRRYRVAFIEAFRKHGIFPLDVRAMGEDSLRWRTMDDEQWECLKGLFPPPEVFRTMVAAWEFAPMPMLDDDSDCRMAVAEYRGLPDELRKIFLKAYWPEEPPRGTPPAGRTEHPRDVRRHNLYDVTRQFGRLIYLWLATATGNATEDKLLKVQKFLGLDLAKFWQYLELPEGPDRDGAIEVHDVRPTFRVHADGRTKIELLVILTQRKKGLGEAGSGSGLPDPNDPLANYHFRGGCTLLIDPETGRIRYAISKGIDSRLRRKRIEQFLRQQIDDLGDAALDRFHLRARDGRRVEPLAILHRTSDNGAC